MCVGSNDLEWPWNAGGEGLNFSGGLATLSSQCAGPSISKILICAHTLWKTATKFCIVIKPDERKNFQGQPRPLPWPKFLVTRMLTRDLLAEDNHFVCSCRICSGRTVSRIIIIIIITKCTDLSDTVTQTMQGIGRFLDRLAVSHHLPS